MPESEFSLQPGVKFEEPLCLAPGPMIDRKVDVRSGANVRNRDAKVLAALPNCSRPELVRFYAESAENKRLWRGDLHLADRH